jgi:YfiH family protein
MMINTLSPDWPVSVRVKAFVTTREGGVSLPPYHTLNLAGHVGDDPEAVAENRQRVKTQLSLPSEPIWLSQTHSCDIYDADAQPLVVSAIPVADASITHREQVVLSVMTADCLPILLTNRAETLVMAIHAGWRGLADGIIQQSVLRTGVDPAELLVWIGPGIRAPAFEVGEDVYEAFLSQQTAQAHHFTPLGLDDQGKQKYVADTAQIAKAQLEGLSVGWIGGGHWCTYQDPARFFSYRRSEKTGRMASLIWLSS